MKSCFIILKKKIDILYLQDGLLAPLELSLRVLGKPVVVTVHGLDATYENAVYQNVIPIKEDIPNLGQWFRQESDYETIYAGKWHLPADYVTDIPGFYVINTGLIGQGNYCDTNVSMACEAYIRNRSREKPFLMVASFMQPHDICEWLRLNLENQPELRYPEIKDELPSLKKVIYWDPKGLRNYEVPILISFDEVMELGRDYEKTHPGLFEQNVDEGSGDDIAFIYFLSSHDENSKYFAFMDSFS